jgi:hypothetical protein
VQPTLAAGAVARRGMAGRARLNRGGGYAATCGQNRRLRGSRTSYGRELGAASGGRQRKPASNLDRPARRERSRARVGRDSSVPPHAPRAATRQHAERDQQLPPSDGDCHTPLPCEVRNKKNTTPRACVLTARHPARARRAPSSKAGTLAGLY